MKFWLSLILAGLTFLGACNSQIKSAPSSYNFNVYLHTIAVPDGTTFYDDAEIINQIVKSERYFDDLNIRFTITKVEHFVVDDYTLPSNVYIESIFEDTLRFPGCVNIYVMPPNNTYQGITRFPSTGVNGIILFGFPKDWVIAHEMGHFLLSLEHITAEDGIDDTPIVTDWSYPNVMAEFYSGDDSDRTFTPDQKDYGHKVIEFYHQDKLIK